jgi:hypothetical protein
MDLIGDSVDDVAVGLSGLKQQTDDMTNRRE